MSTADCSIFAASCQQSVSYINFLSQSRNFNGRQASHSSGRVVVYHIKIGKFPILIWFTISAFPSLMFPLWALPIWVYIFNLSIPNFSISPWTFPIWTIMIVQIRKVQGEMLKLEMLRVEISSWEMLRLAELNGLPQPPYECHLSVNVTKFSKLFLHSDVCKIGQYLNPATKHPHHTIYCMHMPATLSDCITWNLFIISKTTYSTLMTTSFTLIRTVVINVSQTVIINSYVCLSSEV